MVSPVLGSQDSNMVQPKAVHRRLFLQSSPPLSCFFSESVMKLFTLRLFRFSFFSFMGCFDYDKGKAMVVSCSVSMVIELGKQKRAPVLRLRPAQYSMLPSRKSCLLLYARRVSVWSPQSSQEQVSQVVSHPSFPPFVASSWASVTKLLTLIFWRLTFFLFIVYWLIGWLIIP